MPRILTSGQKTVILSVLLTAFCIMVLTMLIRLFILVIKAIIEYVQTRAFPVEWYHYIDMIVIGLCTTAIVLWVQLSFASNQEFELPIEEGHFGRLSLLAE